MAEGSGVDWQAVANAGGGVIVTLLGIGWGVLNDTLKKLRGDHEALAKETRDTYARRDDMRSLVDGLRSDMKDGFADLKEEFRSLRDRKADK